MKILRYTIKVVVEYDALSLGDIADLIQRIQEEGIAEIENVELIEGEL